MWQLLSLKSGNWEIEHFFQLVFAKALCLHQGLWLFKSFISQTMFSGQLPYRLENSYISQSTAAFTMKLRGRKGAIFFLCQFLPTRKPLSGCTSNSTLIDQERHGAHAKPTSSKMMRPPWLADNLHYTLHYRLRTDLWSSLTSTLEQILQQNQRLGSRRGHSHLARQLSVSALNNNKGNVPCNLLDTDKISDQ